MRRLTRKKARALACQSSPGDYDSCVEHMRTTASANHASICGVPVPKQARNWKRLIAGGSSLILLTLTAYWPSLHGGFVWDDQVLVLKNPLATGDLNLLSVWFAGDFPLTTVVTWIEWLVFGNNPTGYRLTNAGLHCLSAFLAWRFFARLAIPQAWLAAALFAVHPIAVASVAWISELKNVLSLPFFLLSGWAFLAFEEECDTGNPARARRYYGLSLVAFLLALLAKTSTVVLPMALAAGIWWRRRTIAAREWRRLAPYFCLALAFGCMTVWFQSHQAIRGTIVQTEPAICRLALAGQALWFYLGKALFPENLCMIYPLWKLGTFKAVSLLPLIGWLGILSLAWYFRRGLGRSVFFSLICFTAALLPVLGLLDMYFMIFSRVSDHLAYLALLAITPLVAAGTNLIASKPAFRACGVVLLGLLTFQTWERARLFASDEALWRDTVAKNPSAWSAQNNLACNLAERGQIEAAIEHFQKSLELYPHNQPAHLNLAKALAAKKRFVEAEPHFQEAFKLKPDDLETLTAYADCLAANRHPAEAIAMLRRAIQIKPDEQLRLKLAPLLAETGNHAAAAEEMQHILASNSESVEALNNLAWLRATCPDPRVRDGESAVRLAKDACRLAKHPEPVTFATLAAAYAEIGDFTNAVRTAQTAIEMAMAHGNEQFAEINRQLQRLYLSGHPFRTPMAAQSGRGATANQR